MLSNCERNEMKGLRLLTLIFLGLVSGCGGGSFTSADTTLQVFCAASLTEVVQEFSREYSARTGVEVTINSAGSSTLARQILAGGRADLYLSASEAWMDRLQEAGQVSQEDRHRFARNRLVLAVDAESPLRLSSPCKLTELGEIRLLAMGDPDHVPAGVYGKQWLQSVRCGDETLWHQLQHRLSPAPDVRAALAQVRAGPDVVALVYATDVATRRNRVRVLLEIPEREQPEIHYTAGILKESPAREAAEVWIRDFLHAEGQSVLRKHGFVTGEDSDSVLQREASSMTHWGTLLMVTSLWATLATAGSLVLGVPVAYLLARGRFRGKRALSAVIGLPMVMPPTAVGFLLLLFLAERGVLAQLGIQTNWLFTWKAVVLAQMVMALPFVIRTARVAFEEVDPRLEQLARTLGFTRQQVWTRVTVPLAGRGLVAAGLLGFTRALGEFGATVMIAGTIPGRTQTLASAIYSAQQSGDDARAGVLLVVAALLGIAVVYLTETLSRPGKRGKA